MTEWEITRRAKSYLDAHALYDAHARRFIVEHLPQIVGFLPVL